MLKLFPAESLGGTALIDAVGAVYPGVQFIPTGGIETKNIGDYLAIPNVVACGGSWMVKAELMTENRFDEIKKLSEEGVPILAGTDLGNLYVYPGFSLHDEMALFVEFGVERTVGQRGANLKLNSLRSDDVRPGHRQKLFKMRIVSRQISRPRPQRSQR